MAVWAVPLTGGVWGQKVDGYRQVVQYTKGDGCRVIDLSDVRTAVLGGTKGRGGPTTWRGTDTASASLSVSAARAGHYTSWCTVGAQPFEPYHKAMIFSTLVKRWRRLSRVVGAVRCKGRCMGWSQAALS